MAVGSPEQIRKQLTALAEQADVNEIVISTFTEHFEDRLRSYELLAQTFGLTASSFAPPAAQAVSHDGPA